MKIANLIVFLLLIGTAGAQAGDVYVLTLSVDNGNFKVISKELAQGYTPQAFEGGSYAIKDKSSAKISEGKFALPKGVIMEKFREDNTIEGTFAPFEGQFTVIAPAFEDAAEVVLLDDKGKELVSVDVSEIKTQDSLEGSGSFFLRYEWLFLILKYLVILLAVIFGARYAIRRLRKKK